MFFLVLAKLLVPCHPTVLGHVPRKANTIEAVNLVLAKLSTLYIKAHVMYPSSQTPRSLRYVTVTFLLLPRFELMKELLPFVGIQEGLLPVSCGLLIG